MLIFMKYIRMYLIVKYCEVNEENNLHIANSIWNSCNYKWTDAKISQTSPYIVSNAVEIVTHDFWITTWILNLFSFIKFLLHFSPSLNFLKYFDSSGGKQLKVSQELKIGKTFKTFLDGSSLNLDLNF
jgi:hypothetical protein